MAYRSVTYRKQVEAGAVTGEDDRHYVAFSAGASCAPLPECPYQASEYTVGVTGGGALSFFKTSSGAELADAEPWPGPTGVWVEGRGVTDVCGAGAKVFLHCPTLLHSCRVEPSRHIVVAKVASLEWQLYALSYDANSCTQADNEGLSHCPNNGGVRIFPDKLSPGDLTPTIRQKVDLVATIEPPVAGVNVYMRVYDVDDPFDQVHGSQGLNDIANVSLVDPNGAAGGDNRPNPGPGGTYSGVTDKMGTARSMGVDIVD